MKQYSTAIICNFISFEWEKGVNSFENGSKLTP